jgi:hypothetical protein
LLGLKLTEIEKKGLKGVSRVEELRVKVIDKKVSKIRLLIF